MQNTEGVLLNNELIEKFSKISNIFEKFRND